MKKIIHPIGTIFMYLGEVFVATDNKTTKYPYPAQIGWNGKRYNNCASLQEVTLINSNFVNSGLTKEEILRQFNLQLETIKNEGQKEYDETVETFNTLLKTKAELVATSTTIRARGIKPQPTTIEKVFQFGGQYNTPIITIRVIDKLGTVTHRTMQVNGNQLNSKEIEALVAVINAKVAGLEIAPDTIKWGTSIGYTRHIREAINYYFLLPN